MKKLRVIVRDRNTLILEEDGAKGDIIDLSDISNIDVTQLEQILAEGKDAILKKRLEEQKYSLQQEAAKDQELLKQQFDSKIEKLTHELSLEKEKYQNDLETKLKEVHYNKTLELQKLQQELESKASEFQQILETERLSVEKEFQSQIHALKTKLLQKENEKDLEKTKALTNIEKLKSENVLKLQEIVRQFHQESQEAEQKYQELNEKFLNLQRQKASLNVKQTGEDLEAWCDAEVKAYMQNGFRNCTWEKDNLVVKDISEAKGSKADYIFKIFSNEACKTEDELASVCLDMKDENPDSLNRKKNADYFRALDHNRNKKHCKYAVLVSNLELDKPNDIPIYKVREYEEMYVVRPAYLMTFLNMLVSLTTRFSTLITVRHKELLALKNSLELKEEFERLKNTYLDKPLQALEKNIEEIQTSCSKIEASALKIKETCESIKKSYLNEIENKLSRFEIQMEKSYKKLPN